MDRLFLLLQMIASSRGLALSQGRDDLAPEAVTQVSSSNRYIPDISRAIKAKFSPYIASGGFEANYTAGTYYGVSRQQFRDVYTYRAH